MSEADFEKMLQRLEESTKRQEEYEKRRYFLAKVRLAISACVLLLWVVAGCILIPGINRVVQQADETFCEVETAMEGLQSVADQIEAADIGGVMSKVNALITDGQEDMTAAMEKISAIDIEGLNQGIQDLQAIVAPLARLFGR